MRYRISEIVVEARRPVVLTGGAAAVETDVDSLPLRANATAEDVLRSVPLLHVRTNSRGEAEISARGSESRQVAVLIDGVPITLAWDARADLSVVPATAWQEITFVRGLSSMLHGPNVLGGVVEISSGRIFEQPERASAEITLGADHVGGFGSTLTGVLPWSNGSGKWLLRAGTGFRDSPGLPLADGIQEPVETDDDLRLNTDASGRDAFLAARYASKDGLWLSGLGSMSREKRGIAPELGLSDEDARLWRYPVVSRGLVVLSGGTGMRSSPFGGQGDIEVGLGLNRGRTEIDQYASRAYGEVVGFENGEDRTLTARLLAGQSIGGSGHLRAALTMADIHYDEILTGGTSEYQQRLTSGGLETTWRVIRSSDLALTLTAGGAYDAASTPKTGGRPSLDRISEWGGRAGGTLALDDGETVFHGGISRRGRFPALRELYSGALNRFEPNPDLKPEKLLTVEAGGTQKVGFEKLRMVGEMHVVGFFNQLDDAVVRTTLPDRKFKRVNRNELQSVGMEAIAIARWEQSPIGALSLSASATWQDVELTDKDADETHRPENLPEIFGDFGAECRFGRGTRLGVGVEHTGQQFALNPLDGEDDPLPGETVINAHISQTWPMPEGWGGAAFRHLETRIALQNAAEAAVYDAWGLPEPGRLWRFEVRMY